MATVDRARHWMRQQLAPTLLRMLQALGLTVSREDVIWCYRQFLGRDPESEQAILWHRRFLSFRGLVRCIVSSPEYAGRRALPVLDTGAPARTIGELAFRAAIDDYLDRHPEARNQEPYITMHFERLLDTLNLVARLLPDGGRMLDFSAMGFFAHAVGLLLPGVGQVNVTGVNFELEDYAERFGLGRHDLCLNTEVLEHLLYDPSRMVHGINRMLRPGGHLVLSTPNAISMGNAIRLLTGNPPTLWNQLNASSRHYFDRHNRDWTPFEVKTLLEEHGFEVTGLFTRDYYDETKTILARHPAQCRWLAQNGTHAYWGDTQFVLARKVRESEAPVRRPWLYVLPAGA